MVRFVKRILDIVGALVASILFLPIVVIASALIYTRMGTPIFFWHERSGKNKKRFKVLKLRTMLDDPEGRLRDRERITPLGQVLRKYSIDEMPQIWNVLKGDMSLVGPRPLLVEYDDHYNSDQNRRFHVRPGITGLAQVNGRNDISWEEKLKLDTEYVEKLSIWLDIVIMFKTVWVVAKSVGFQPSGEETKFNKNK